MTPEKHRGYPFPDGEIHQESQALGSYQSWDEWRGNLEKWLGCDFSKINGTVNQTLKEAYNLRRNIQRGEATLDEWLMFSRELSDKFLDNHGDKLALIVQRTEASEISQKAAELRGRPNKYGSRQV